VQIQRVTPAQRRAQRPERCAGVYVFDLFPNCPGRELGCAIAAESLSKGPRARSLISLIWSDVESLGQANTYAEPITESTPSCIGCCSGETKRMSSNLSDASQ